MGIVIRQARLTDLDWLVGELRAFSEFFGSKKPLFSNEEFVREGMKKMMEQHLVLVAEQGSGGLMGFISGLVSPHVFNPTITVLSETFWWVAEAHRRSRAGLELLNAFVEWGKNNVDWILFFVEQKSPVSTRTMEKRGFRLLENAYLLETA